jgi:tRNA (guanine-N1)-methyltransferase
MVRDGLHTSILGRAAANGHIQMNVVNIRDYTLDKHKKVDDYPYGGGAGMLMQAQPIYDAYLSVCKEIEKAGMESAEETVKRPRCVYVTPQGGVFNQSMAVDFAKEEDLIYCGTRRIRGEKEFHGKMFRDNQVSNVYCIWRNVEPEECTLQLEEVEEVRWIGLEECKEKVAAEDPGFCIKMEELLMLPQE